MTTYSRKTQTVSASTVQVGTHHNGTVIGAGADWIDVALGSQRFHFVLAPHASVIYRLLPAQLTIAKAGQRVDVREYQAGAELLATRVELLVIHVHHPRAHTQHGLVGSLFAGGFILDSVTGQRLVILYSGSVRPQEKVSVRGWVVSGGFHAEKVRQILHLVYHHLLAHTEHGLVGSLIAGGFTLNTVSGQQMVVLYAGSVQPQEQVSVRGWAVTGGFHAQKVRRILHLAVRTVLVRGYVSVAASG